jgi:cytoskeletal protein CcmA (bactofilin family)
VLKKGPFSFLKQYTHLGKSAPEVQAFFIPFGMKMNGDVSGECKGRIDGHYSGKINISDKLIIGKDAVVFGFLFANEVIIYGKVEGEIYSKGKVTIMNGAVIHGDVFANNFLVEEKAVVEGNLKKQSPEDLLKIFAAKYKQLGLNSSFDNTVTHEGELLLSIPETNAIEQELTIAAKSSPILPQYRVNTRWF